MTDGVFARKSRTAASSLARLRSKRFEPIRRAAGVSVEVLERRQLMSVSPIASYPFAEGSGTTAADASGNGNTGTLNGGITWTSDTPTTSGTALKFDGTSGYVDLGNPTDLNLTGTITLSAWVKPLSTSGIQDIIAKGYSTSPYGEDFLRINSGNYQVGSWDGGNHLTSAAIPPTDLNTWVQLTGTYDGSAWNLYRDGLLISSTTNSTGAVAVNSGWAIGAGGNSDDRRFFNGTIDDAQIYDQAVSPAAISQFALPTGWSDNDIGSPGLAGGTTYDGTAFNVSGSGTDITDQFNFASQNFSGDGSIVAQVTSQTDTNTWAKAGVMFRNDGSAGSAFAALFVTPGQGVSFQWRSTADDDESGSYSQLTGISAPTWLKISREGDNFTASYSSDGLSWIQVGVTETAAVSTDALAGLAVTSHDGSTLSQATFTNVSIDPALVLTADTTITNDSGTPLVNNEDIETAGYVLTFDGTGSIVNTGTISGTGSLAKTGDGVLTLTGFNTYTDATTVSGGTLLLAGAGGSATGSGSVTVESGATLAGTGIATGSVIINSGGNLSPGSSAGPGILNIGDLTLASGSNLNITINSNTPGTGFSQVAVTGDASVDGSNLVLGGSQSSTASASVNFLVVTNTVTGTLAGDTTLNGVTYNTLYIPCAGAGVALTTGSALYYEVTLGEGMTGSTWFTDTDTLHVAVAEVAAYSPEQAIEEAVAGTVYIDQSIIGNGVLGPFSFPGNNIVIRNDISPDRQRLTPSELGLNAQGDGTFTGFLGLNDDNNLANNDNDFNDRIWTVEVTPVV